MTPVRKADDSAAHYYIHNYLHHKYFQKSKLSLLAVTFSYAVSIATYLPSPIDKRTQETSLNWHKLETNSLFNQIHGLL